MFCTFIFVVLLQKQSFYVDGQLTININHLLYTAMKTPNLKYFGVTILIFRGHVTSSVTWPLNSAYVVLMAVYCNHASILHCNGNMGPQIYWGHDHDFWGHVTSSVTWPSNSAFAPYWWSMMTTRLSHEYGDTGLRRFWGHEFDLLGLCDVIGHVTIGLGICGFLLVVHCNHASILHRYGDIGPQR